MVCHYMIGTCLLHVQRFLQFFTPCELTLCPTSCLLYTTYPNRPFRVYEDYTVALAAEPGLKELRCVQHNRLDVRVRDVSCDELVASCDKPGVEQILQPL